MGQRLNIEIVKNGKVLANSYYHWSGYSNSAVNMVVQIIQEYEYIKKYKVEKYIKNQDLLLAIRLLEETGAGLNDIDMTRNILKDETMNLKLKKCQGRDEGIIGITQKDIEETRYWEEGRVSIDIENKKIDFGVINEYTEEEFNYDYDEEIKELNIKKIDINFKNISFEDIFELKAFIDKANYKEEYYFYNKNNNKYVFLIQ
jgi:hypothetical protein